MMTHHWYVKTVVRTLEPDHIMYLIANTKSKTRKVHSMYVWHLTLQNSHYWTFYFWEQSVNVLPLIVLKRWNSVRDTSVNAPSNDFFFSRSGPAPLRSAHFCTISVFNGWKKSRLSIHNWVIFHLVQEIY